MTQRMTVLLPILAFASAAFAQDPSDSHQVTVNVKELAALEHIGGDLTLTLDTLDALDASKFVAVSDSSTQLAWSTNGKDRKVTVSSDVASPRFGLTVEAASLSGGGSAAPAPVVLDAALGAQDLITGISAESAGCNLTYTASADVADGVGSEVHTVTYTLTAM